ncbi:unnamed protein product [Arabidopsis thaliana]|uniref:glutamate decarboxylase n=1 Tax=Arabidopsis thaliana TaxID=3702 RepID=A0A5S9XD43_ARATH|nr:unnamed protein product [Arabidopsis thaliana]
MKQRYLVKSDGSVGVNGYVCEVMCDAMAGNTKMSPVNRCVNMIANLFHAPVGQDEAVIGCGIVASSESAGLAFKMKWQHRRKAQGLPIDKPNIVTGVNVQVCWEKFARYFEVELKEVKLSEDYYVMDPAKAVEMVDENSICVAAILGSTFTGEFEYVKLLNDLLAEKNAKTAWETPIHVDAASGGFIASMGEEYQCQ